MTASLLDDYSREGAELSVTDLLKPNKVVWHNRNSVVSMDDPLVVRNKVFSMFGTALHNMMDKAAEFESDVIVEERLFIDVEGVKLTGKIDRQVCGDSYAIKDYKVTSVSKAMRFVNENKASRLILNREGEMLNDVDEWTMQLNIYAWMASRLKGVKVRKLSIIAFLRDWSAVRANKTGTKYPDSPVMELDIPLLDLSHVEKFVRKRVKSLANDLMARNQDEVTPCRHSECWPSGVNKFHVYRNAKNNSVSFGNLKDAMAKLEEFSKQPDFSAAFARVEYRPPELIRCEHYCEFASICNQKAERERMMENKIKAIEVMSKIAVEDFTSKRETNDD